MNSASSNDSKLNTAIIKLINVNIYRHFGCDRHTDFIYVKEACGCEGGGSGRSANS